MRPEAFGVAGFTGRMGKEHDLGPECVGEFHRHVPKTAEPDHTDLLSSGHIPAAHGRVSGDSGAQERRAGGEIELV